MDGKSVRDVTDFYSGAPATGGGEQYAPIYMTRTSERGVREWLPRG